MSVLLGGEDCLCVLSGQPEFVPTCCLASLSIFPFMHSIFSVAFVTDCHVFDCGILADDVLATVGQTFNIVKVGVNRFVPGGVCKILCLFH